MNHIILFLFFDLSLDWGSHSVDDRDFLVCFLCVLLLTTVLVDFVVEKVVVVVVECC